MSPQLPAFRTLYAADEAGDRVLCLPNGTYTWLFFGCKWANADPQSYQGATTHPDEARVPDVTGLTDDEIAALCAADPDDRERLIQHWLRLDRAGGRPAASSPGWVTLPDGTVVRASAIDGVSPADGCGFCVVWGSRTSVVELPTRDEAERTRAHILRIIGATGSAAGA